MANSILNLFLREKSLKPFLRTEENEVMPKIKKQIKCKQVKFSIDEWNKVEQRAAGVKMKTATYIQRMAVDGKIMRLENSESRNVIKEMNRIGVSINQIARKANETHNLYAADIEKLKGEHEELCLILNQYVSGLRLTEV